MSKEAYNQRRNNSVFILYGIYQLFIRTLKLRIKKKKYFFLPSRHIGAIYLLNMLTVIFDKNDKEFFLWDASLLGAARDQGTIAGSARDIDIAIIFNKKKDFKFIISLKKLFKVRVTNNYNSLQLHHKLGLIDISIFHQKGPNYQVNVLDLDKDNGPPDKNRFSNAILESLTEKKFDKSLTKTLSFHKNEFFPFKRKKLYSKKYSVPNMYLGIVKKIYGSKWKVPDKKEQTYFT